MFSTLQRRIDHLSPNSTPEPMEPTLDPKFFQQRSKKFETRDNKGEGNGRVISERINRGLIERPLYLLETVPFKACTRPRRSPIFDPPPPSFAS